MKKTADNSIEALGAPSNRKYRLQTIFVLILIPVTLILLVLLCQFGVRQLYRKNSAFQLSTIEIVTPLDQLRTSVGEYLLNHQIQEGMVTLTSIDIGKIRADLSEDPRVVSVEARRIFPGTLRISIKPRVPVAELLFPPLRLRIDLEGYVVPRDLPGNTNRLPIITNLSPSEDFVVGKKTDNSYMLAFLTFLRECSLRPDGTTYEVASVQMEPQKEKMILCLKGNDIFENEATVYMPPTNIPAHLDRLGTIVGHRRQLRKKISFADLTVTNVPVRPE